MIYQKRRSKPKKPCSNAKGLKKNENYWKDDTMWLWADKIELL